MKTKTLLVTGGAGFIGSNFIRWCLKNRPNLAIKNLDALTYSGNLANLEGVEADPRYTFIYGDICDRPLVESLLKDCCAVVHFAAESHVDRSIENAAPFIRTNVEGTQVLLDSLRKLADGQLADEKLAAGQAIQRRLVNVSTDEVYGSLSLAEPDQQFTEESPLCPNNPYAASKAAADLLVRSYHQTYGLDVVTTRCSNNFGPYQFPEKLIPHFVTQLKRGNQVPLYGDGHHVRDWIHVDDHCEALIRVLEDGKAGEVYNIGASNESSNLALTLHILKAMNLSEQRIEYVPDRRGHDQRYALCTKKLRDEIDWRPRNSRWPDALLETVRWYLDHEDWWREILDGSYLERRKVYLAR